MNQSPTEAALKLMALGKSLVLHKGWAPKDGKTYCNFAAAAAANYYGYNKLYDKPGEPLMANDIINKILKDKDWKQADQNTAYDAAMQGKLVLAYYSEAPHGHAALVAPLPRVWSAKWSSYAAQVYNVGATMNLEYPYTEGENFAFKFKPNHVIYAPVS